jgi:hypothetical protein
MKAILLPAAAMLHVTLFQLPATPPIKMGLWESNVTSTMKMPGMPSMPGMGRPQTSKVHSCMTPETYAKNLARSQNQRKDCTRNNESWTPGKYTADISCPSSDTKGHIEMEFTSMEAAHGTMHIDMTHGGQSMIMDMEMNMHFISADCGSVTPDKPEIIK